MERPKALSPITIVITVEGLSTAPLGCYGSSIGETPAIDDVAARGVVFDRWTSPIDRPSGLIRHWLKSCDDPIQNDAPASLCVTDDAQLDEADFDPIFGEVRKLDSKSGGSIAPSIERTQLARTFFELMDHIDSDTELAWLHTATLRDSWDWIEVPLPDPDEDTEPPSEEFSDEEPEPPIEPLVLPDNADVPHLELDSEGHPDLLFSWMQRYANQAFVLDTMIDALVQFLGERPFTMIIAGASGFSLGDNRWIGHHAGPLRSADIRLPMIVSGTSPLRVPSVTSADQFANIIRAAIAGQSCMTPAAWSHRDEEFTPQIHTDSDRATSAITTASWFLVSENDDPMHAKLFLKPDDLNDVNDVARLRPNVVNQLLAEESGDDTAD
ncbi:hypothetical protein [Rhodopirellula sp. MGV]|uniref:hypothetical protein n=1 Tax=Rhodopirellula sp. MGV TaxID=2023130 RepID=UPI000B979EBA|nr:hypothetical protein [Rhodopirellula sp. MGV]OYP28382.1 hypothetical protein CGZ80_26580 [Rhodopirellula sp. MGV]PNY38742.1 hypothetical protein C2E31_02210 [Rhodopirellula baltica]